LGEILVEGGSDGIDEGELDTLGIKEDTAVGKELFDGDIDGSKLGSPLGINEGESVKVGNVLGWLLG